MEHPSASASFGQMERRGNVSPFSHWLTDAWLAPIFSASWIWVSPAFCLKFLIPFSNQNHFLLSW